MMGQIQNCGTLLSMMLKANYDPDNIDSNDFSFGGTPRESTTDMLMVQMGITFKF